ncbi:PREDICTED: protein-cysteine N-palmitoyltransferase HHAT isoform X1 [Polistes canadensis]|uniref:protein-cysteine N-palmitoyltransferase HHAT isoform X1 n=2 Tax=Polistes canadensis TaxID=91411 RepID=UPI000718E59F|nr:PREDICTED: protein-cysteine N-palmitoyltransferase HHAT isoform X1 [Polistes canadensis]XP_014606279.1 PREDICTED: protein-cysteine N-palmitoyltransferase HHAT isoform X1 [Polistes canadensis]
MGNSICFSNKYERIFYFFMWIGGVAYSIYNVYLTNTHFKDYYDVYSDFVPGWLWIGRKQDVSDQEWRVWIPLMITLIPWIFLHHVVSQIIKNVFNKVQLLCCWYTLISILFLCYYLGTVGTLCILAQSSLLYLLNYVNSKKIIWLVHVLFLFIIHVCKIPNGFFYQWLQYKDDEHYLLLLAMCWIQLRSISQNMNTFKMHYMKNYTNFFNNYLQMLAYCLYLPTLFLGPLILYHEFLNALDKSPSKWNFMRAQKIIINLIRYIFWYYFTEFSLHFVYINVLQYHPKIVENLNSWALYGLGYCMGQFFLNKYVVIYGINKTLCEADGIEAPLPPKCIGRIHLYSDMWKSFDRGLYKFLIRYIYVPVMNTTNSKSYHKKLFASFLCFTFVFLWHGMQTNIFTWALLNFIGLNIENLSRIIGNTKIYNKILEKYLSSWNRRRLNCALASILLAMSAISNFFFFAGQKIGNIYINRILNDSWSTTSLLLFFLYCCCHVSIDTKLMKM